MIQGAVLACRPDDHRDEDLFHGLPHLDVLLCNAMCLKVLHLRISIVTCAFPVPVRHIARQLLKWCSGAIRSGSVGTPKSWPTKGQA